ncbi:MAG TPA: ABC transporter substrate-binding protein [Stellaceae bacterium]|nr:ABC transporter substrate-binding protein [Stellaceae bacterium]
MKIRFLAVGAACAAMVAHAAWADGPVKIGVLTDQSSLYSDATGKGSVTAAQMAAEDFGGKVLGQPIEIVSADHQNKPDVGTGIANKWFDTDGVDAIADVPTSSVALAVETVSRNKHKIALFSGPASSDITGKFCSPYAVHWTYDTYTLAHVTGGAMVKAGGDSWYFITADYAFGHALERDTAAVVTASGGKVIGHSLVPINNQDFSSFMLQAQASKAKVIGLANAGGDTINSIKAAGEFGITQAGQKLAGLLLFITDVHSLGLKTAQGLVMTTAFYWDQDDKTRAWSKRFYERMHKEPTMIQAGVYGAVFHYLKAVKAAGTKDPDKVMAEMRAIPINDFMTENGKLRIDGRVLRDSYLYEVKKPSESKGEWDLLKLIAKVGPEQSIRPLDQGGCPLVAKN